MKPLLTQLLAFRINSRAALREADRLAEAAGTHEAWEHRHQVWSRLETELSKHKINNNERTRL